MNIQKRFTELYDASRGDSEVIHEEADMILLEFVPEDVKKAYLDLRALVGFWYA